MEDEGKWTPAHLAVARKAVPTISELALKIGDERLQRVVVSMLQGGAEPGTAGTDTEPAVNPNSVAIPLVRELMRLEAILAQLAAMLDSLPEPVVTWWLELVDSATISTGGSSSLDAWRVQREVSRAADQLAALSRLWNQGE